MEGKIVKFSGDYEFLSNFYNSEIEYKGIVYKNSESAYQAQKLDPKYIDEYIQDFVNINANIAKKLGREIPQRDDWEEVRLNIMYEITLAKYTQSEELRQLLISTGNKVIIEGNYWEDTFWGVCNDIGENNLGKIIMRVRGEIR